jgi:hypothetical protein
MKTKKEKDDRRPVHTVLIYTPYILLLLLSSDSTKNLATGTHTVHDMKVK